LQEGVRQGGEGDVPFPAGQRAPFKMVEPQFVFEFLILLLDGPALVREPDQGD
jgi:hypothetical protein